MALLGINDLKQYALPDGWDATLLAKLALADGTTYDTVVNEIAVALQAQNAAIINDPIYGGLIFLTTQRALEYRQGAGNTTEDRTEYGRGDARRGNTSGHMLPLRSIDREVGWTWDFLRKARLAQIEADIADALSNVADRWQIRILTRFFSDAYNTLGSSGKDAPFVDGTTGDIDYTPPEMGQTFLNTHTHFDRKGTANQADALDAGMQHLREHGIFGPYQATIPDADISTYKALTGFIKPDRGIEFVTADQTARARTMADERYIGMFEGEVGVASIWATPRLPTNYLGVYRSYGPNNPRNPLAVAYSEDLGAGAILMRGEGFRQFPLENAVILQEFGVGANRGRLNGYACFFAAAGGYTAPTIS